MDKISNYYDEILLNFSLSDCKKNLSYLIEFSILENSIKFETEKIKNTSDNALLEFSKTLLCPYYFYKIQAIIINIKKFKDRIHYINYKIENNFLLTLSKIISSQNGTLKIPINKNDENSEILIIKGEKKNLVNNNNYSFIDNLLSGISFDCYIGIDFTDKALHEVNIEKNHYINSIQGIIEILFNFQPNFEVYGYGARLKNLKIKDENDYPYFNLSLNKLRNLADLNSIIKAYLDCLNQLEFCKKNNMLSPLVNNILKKIYEKSDLNKYNILILLINNSPKKDDIQNCIDTFIQSSIFNLSIIIIGIGDKENEFDNIKNLYINTEFSSKGKKKLRDNIFFISMKDCNYDINKLKETCLKDVPKQMMNFVQLLNSIPEIKKEKNTYKIYNMLEKLSMNNSLNKDDNNFEAAPLLIKHVNNLEKENIEKKKYIYGMQKNKIEEENKNKKKGNNRENIEEDKDKKNSIEEMDKNNSDKIKNNIHNNINNNIYKNLNNGNNNNNKNMIKNNFNNNNDIFNPKCLIIKRRKNKAKSVKEINIKNNLLVKNSQTIIDNKIYLNEDKKECENKKNCNEGLNNIKNNNNLNNIFSIADQKRFSGQFEMNELNKNLIKNNFNLDFNNNLPGNKAIDHNKFNLVNKTKRRLSIPNEGINYDKNKNYLYFNIIKNKEAQENEKKKEKIINNNDGINQMKDFSNPFIKDNQIDFFQIESIFSIESNERRKSQINLPSKFNIKDKLDNND